MKNWIAVLLCITLAVCICPAFTVAAATTRPAILQNLNFGGFCLDFGSAAKVDGKTFNNNTVYAVPGDHTLAYTEAGIGYTCPLYLYRSGDVNEDSAVNVVDLVAAKRFLTQSRTLTNAGKAALDFSCDGTYAAADIALLRKTLLNGQATFLAQGDSVDFVVDVPAGRNIKVLQLTDPQIIEWEQARTTARQNDLDKRWKKQYKDDEYHQYITKTVQEYQPDFILITGDLVYGEFDDSGESLQEFITFMDGFKIPWAPVFGNHDNESQKGVDWQCDQLEASDYCLFLQRTLTGNGNYTVGLRQDGMMKRVFFMMDSNGCGSASAQSIANGHTKTSDGFGEDQVAWLRQTAGQIHTDFPAAKLGIAFHIQPAAFTAAFAKYGFDNVTTQTNPINIDALADKGDDFGYLGRVLKSPWDSKNEVFNVIKSLGFDCILVGHEHCNSASVSYRGIRFQYGLKSSTYDRANYLVSRDLENGTVSVSGSFAKSAYPIVGGTAIPLNTDGSLGKPYNIFYHESNIPRQETVQKTTAVLDFNGTNFDLSYQDTGLFATGYRASLITNPDTLPSGFTGAVYGNKNNGTSGMCSVSMKFAKKLNFSAITKITLRMYVSSYTATKAPLMRIFAGEVFENDTGANFTACGGSYGSWVDVDITALVKNNTAVQAAGNRIVAVYRYYTGDTSAACYFDSISITYTGNSYFTET